MKVFRSTFLTFLLLFPNFGSIFAVNSGSTASDDKQVQEDQNETSRNFVGQTKKRSAAILDNFKEQQKVLLFDSTPFSSDEEATIFESEDKIQAIERVLRRIEQSKNAYREGKKIVSQKKRTLLEELQIVDANIDETQKSLEDIESDIRLSDSRILELTLIIEELQKKIDTNKQIILEYIANIYLQGNSIFNQNSDIDLIQTLVMNEGNVSDILNDIHYKSIIELTGQRLLEQHKSLHASLYAQKQSIKEEKGKQLKFRKSLEQKQEELDEQKTYKSQLLELTKNDEAKFNTYIIERATREQQLKNALLEHEESYTRNYLEIAKRYQCQVEKNGSGVFVLVKQESPKCRVLTQYYNSEKELKSESFDSDSTNPFLWPVSSPVISAYYRDEDYYAQMGSDHEAIDIAVPQGTEIRAPAPGYIFFINPPKPGTYGYFAMKHRSGLVTVYGHVSEITAQPFTFIPAGQVIAKTGGKIGTAGAGLMTSGPHLHFEAHLNGKSVDPLRYLDISFLRYESMPTRYKYKFARDLKLRYGDRVNTTKYESFKIIGETEQERQKYLLEKYATLPFQNHSLWIEEGVAAKIDPSFLMCIGLAESGLGKRLKTNFNVGNIGNTDSGGTYEFISAQEGIYWMGKTLNNSYLGSYQGVSQLSRWGNKTGPIYASSATHWHDNVIRCLSAMKGRFIEDDFKFRLSENEFFD